MKKVAAVLFVFGLAAFLSAFLLCASPAYAAECSARIRLTYNGKSYVYSASDAGADLIDVAELHKRGFYLEGAERERFLNNIVSLGFSKEEAVRYIYFNIEKTAAKIEKDINRAAADSKVTFRPKASAMFTFSKEKEGYAVDVPLLYERIFAASLKGGNFEVAVPVDTLAPKYTRAFWKSNITERAVFSTEYEGSTSERKHNIALALRKYNGLTVAAGKSVSFNATVGKRSEARGFKTARVIIGGAYEEGVGGGVCQASTTLYNALLLADVKITERWAHSLSSSYVLPGFDAMVNGSEGDLKFKNDTDLPLFIKTVCTNGRAYVKIYGAKRKYSVVRRYEEKNIISPPQPKVIFDREGKYSEYVYYSDETHMLQPEKEGKTVIAYLDYYGGGKLIKTVKLHTDKYHALQAVIVAGTKPRPRPKPPPPPPEPVPMPIPAASAGEIR